MSLYAGPTVVTHECTDHISDDVHMSPSLTQVVADLQLLIASSGRVYQPCQGHSSSATLVALLLLAGGIESNLGLSQTSAKTSTGISFGFPNARSAFHKAALIQDGQSTSVNCPSSRSWLHT